MKAEDPLPSTPEYRALAPVYNLSDKAERELLDASGLPIWSGYGFGLKRTACWVCPGQRPSTYAVLRREFPCLYRAMEDLETVIGPMRCWDPKFAGLTISQVADYGGQTLPAVGGANDEQGEPEGCQLAAGDSPFGVTGGGAGE